MLSKAKLFVVRKPSACEIIPKSANQIVVPKFPMEVQNCCTVLNRPLSFLEGVWVRDYVVECKCIFGGDPRARR